MTVKEHIGKVYLEPIEHVYIHRETGERFKSVTTIIQMIEPHFDEEGVATAISKQSDLDPKKDKRYIGLTKDQILEYWQFLNDEANRYGTYVHDTIEKYLKANKWFFPDDPLQKRIIEGYESLNIDEGEIIQPERIMFSEEYKIAGMSDLIIDINRDFFDVGDWKTNKVFNFFNPYGFETLLKPFDHLQNCQWSIYTIQLSIYAYLYEMETGKKCRQIWIGYWDKTTDTFSKIQLMYLKNEAKKLLDLYKLKQSLN